jgi:uncharacterized protein
MKIGTHFGIFSLFLLLLTLSFAALAQIPPKPNPPKLVNDMANLLTPEQVSRLESKLVQYNDTTSTQIVVITLSDLNGYDIDDLAQRIGAAWGVGQSATDNGIIILVKPKLGNERGQAAIATGYGMEEIIPDAVARRIVDNEMIPYFKENNYNDGINTGVDIIFDLMTGRYSAEQYVSKENSPLSFIIPLVIIILVIVLMGRNKGGGQSNIGSSNLPLWILLSMLGGGGGGRSGSNWGGSSGGFGGGGGGFGGFGGGGFGGGGASGSW